MFNIKLEDAFESGDSLENDMFKSSTRTTLSQDSGKEPIPILT